MAAIFGLAFAPSIASGQTSQEQQTVPPRVAQARRFLAQRGRPTRRVVAPSTWRPAAAIEPHGATSTPSTSVWEPLGPSAVLTSNFGLVTGRISSIAIDPSDGTGNRVFVGTTGGGVWASQNAASSGNVVFTPLTDNVAFANVPPSISIGALTVQPGGTGVILAGTGDPNDALDSYYGAGILRSADGGNTWSSISNTADRAYSFAGEGFAGFAWSMVNPQLVVAAVSEAYEGTIVDSPVRNYSYAGLYYSTDSGETWSLAIITDGPGADVQGPLDSFAQPNGNSTTSVIWNPIRQLFIAAVRFHGYYQSINGITWTRMTAQPGPGLTAQMCPNNPQTIGSIACPLFRGALAVNPLTGDTFTWTVDLFNQDQGVWQDVCGLSSGRCTNQNLTFSERWSTVPLESNTILGGATIPNADYNLVFAAVPSAQDTVLFAGANDLWKCSLAMGCSWRNTTNARSCMSAQVAPYQHAVEWNLSNPQEILIGNDSGLWRSMDAIAESGSVCSRDDANHFQNLNANLGSLAEVESMAQVGHSPYTMLAGLGANGTAGVKNADGPTTIWPQILTGEGGPVAQDPIDQSNWYVGNNAGASIYRCSQLDNCTPSSFGTTPVVDNADVAGDGYTMTTPAPFIVDPLDNTQLLVGTCRVWRGPVDGARWTSANAISSMLDKVSGLSYCSGDALIRSIAALPIAGGGEVIYVGLYGSQNGGAALGGHVLSTIFVPGNPSMPVWQDISLIAVSNNQYPFNYWGLDISSIFIDPHDPTGQTVYVTVAGAPDPLQPVTTVYRTTDGGAHWYDITSNIVKAPANAIVIDPQDANTAYIATDAGVYSTRQIAACVNAPSNCWSAFGIGLPYAPVTQLSAAPSGTTPNVLVAGTYGRGIWQVPLWTAGTQVTATSIQPNLLNFGSQPTGTTSSAQTLTLTNDGGIALLVSSVSASSNFAETDDCVNKVVNSGANCTIQVSFTPSHSGIVDGQLVIEGNVPGGQIAVPISGMGSSSTRVTASPGSLDFGQVQVGAVSNSLPVTLENAENVAVALTSVTVSPPFSLAANPCGRSLAANSACALSITFSPSDADAATGTLTVIDDEGTQVVALRGSGAAAPTDVLSSSSITFPSTIAGQVSMPQSVTLTNNGDLPLNSIVASASAGFQASSNCGGSLGGHANCTISVTFAPTAAGSVSGTLTVADAIRTQTLSLSGIGLQPPAIDVSATQLTFPSQPVGQAGVPIALTITNSGGAPMANVGFQITGQSASSFSWTASTCGATLSNGNSCSIQVAFKPVSAGPQSGVLVISASTSGVSPVQIGLSGIGQSAAGITINPSQLSFTQATLGMQSQPQAATITNTSNVNAGALVLSTSSPFTVSESTCGSSLAAGANCTATIVFTPNKNAVVNGALTVSSSAFTDPGSAVLVGIGGAAGSIQVLPSSLTFASTGVGTTSTAQSVLLTNNGSVSLYSLALSMSGAFQLSSTTCGVSLDPGASCTAQIAFSPTIAGRQSGTLAVSSPTLPANPTAALSGTGFDFSFSSSGQSSQTVSSGQTASFALTLAPSNGSSGTFTFACSALPTYASCTFNPASEVVSANTTGSVAVQIATGQSSGKANSSGSGGMRTFRALSLACLVIGLPFAFQRKRTGLIQLLVLSLAVMGFASCAGSGGGGGGTPTPGSSNNTPAGTYSVVVTATASGVSHKTTLTLTVD
jgi:hypothetical protein